MRWAKGGVSADLAGLANRNHGFHAEHCRTNWITRQLSLLGSEHHYRRLTIETEVHANAQDVFVAAHQLDTECRIPAFAAVIVPG